MTLKPISTTCTKHLYCCREMCGNPSMLWQQRPDLSAAWCLLVVYACEDVQVQQDDALSVRLEINLWRRRGEELYWLDPATEGQQMKDCSDKYYFIALSVCFSDSQPNKRPFYHKYYVFYPFKHSSNLQMLPNGSGSNPSVVNWSDVAAEISSCSLKRFFLNAPHLRLAPPRPVQK